MITLILIILAVGSLFVLMISATNEAKLTAIVCLALTLMFIVMAIWFVFTGFHYQNTEGQYVGYVTSVEQNGAIFKGWNVYLKTDLQSSNEDVACIDRTNPELIDALKKAQVEKQNVTLHYKGVMQYAIGECPGQDWMIMNIEGKD